MRLPTRARAVQNDDVAKNQEIAEEIRLWLNSVLAEKQISAAEWATRAGVAASTVQRARKEGYEFVTSSVTLAKLAASVNVAAPKFNQAGEDRVVPRLLRVRFRVQAGLWYEVDFDENRELGEFPVGPNPRYASWPQWLEKVNGDSINLRIPDGGYAHVVDAIEMGYAPKHGDYVVVERRRADLRERTIKQVDTSTGKVQLWPRSSNPKWSAPIELDAGPRNEADACIEVVGLVIGAYLDFNQQA